MQITERHDFFFLGGGEEGLIIITESQTDAKILIVSTAKNEKYFSSISPQTAV